MTALSPGPWTFTWDPDTCYIKDQDGEPWGSADGPDHKDITREELEAFGRAMASAHEALAVLKELAKPEDELVAEYVAATGAERPDMTWPCESRQHYQAWVWLRNDVLRNKAAAVLERAGVKL